MATESIDTVSAERTQQIIDALAEEGATKQSVALKFGISVEGVNYHLRKRERQGTALPPPEAPPLLVTIAGETADEVARVEAQLLSARTLLADTQARVAKLEAENALLRQAFGVVGAALPE